MINKKYTATKKNGGIIPDMPVIGYEKEITPNGEEVYTPKYDTRVSEIEIPCGNCIECRQAKAREWQARLSEEIKEWKFKYFVTLTFSPEGLQQICLKKRIPECNAAAAFALRHCLERYRKDHKVSLRHWCVTELGHENTERIHLHGLLMADSPLEFKELERKENGIIAEWKYWKYGIIFVGDFVNQMSVNYMVKYMEKIDNDHKGFIGQVLASPGIGRKWVEKAKTDYKYRPKQTLDFYRLPNGSKIKLPKYWKNKFLNEEERELVWREFMDREKISIRGNNYDQKTVTNKTLSNITTKAQQVNTELGYGTDSHEWRKKNWNITKSMLQSVERLKQQKKMLTSILLQDPGNIENAEKLKKIDEKLAQIEKK